VGRKKNSVALFEVISKSQEKRAKAGLGVPAWMGKSAQVPPSARPGVPPMAPPSATGAARGEPIFSTAAGRLKLSLNYVSCVAIVAGLVLLLAVTFWLGRLSVGAGGPGTIKAAANAPGGTEASRGTKPPQRQRGKYYLVIQAMEGMSAADRAKAKELAEYCTAHGENASEMIHTHSATGRERWIVLSYTAFDQPDSPEAINHAKIIELMGKGYAKKYNSTYDFRQPRDVAGKIKPWYAKY